MSNKKKTGINPYKKNKPPKAVCGNCALHDVVRPLKIGGTVYSMDIGRGPYLICVLTGKETYSTMIPCKHHCFSS